MKLQRQINQLISQQASEWIELVRTGGPGERAAFVAWLKESRRHVSEFLAMVAVDQELQRIDPERRHDLQALLAQITPRAPAHLHELPDSSRQVARRFRRARWTLGVAAGVVACALVLWLMRASLWSGQHYSTTVGEQRAIHLRDSSIVNLDADSEIEVSFGKTAREIRLVHGEALFKVAHESTRPFRVRTRDAVVQAIGTQFNVYARQGATTVSVLEGKVEVSTESKPATARDTPNLSPASNTQSPTPLSAGEEARVSHAGGIQRQAVKDLDKVTAWRQRRLVFRDDTLEEMTYEFNRYNRTPKIRIADDRIKHRHYSGTFDADDPKSLAELLAHERALLVEAGDEEIVIRER